MCAAAAQRHEIIAVEQREELVVNEGDGDVWSVIWG
jgi:hypothetical protein